MLGGFDLRNISEVKYNEVFFLKLLEVGLFELFL